MGGLEFAFQKYLPGSGPWQKPNIPWGTLAHAVSPSCDGDFWSGLLYPQLQNGRLMRRYLGNRDRLFFIFSVLLPATLIFFFLFCTCSHLIFSPIWCFYFQNKTLRLFSPAVLWKGREPSYLSAIGICLQGISLWPALFEQGRRSQPLHANPYSPPKLSAVCNDPGTPPHSILILLLLLERTGFASFNSNKPKIFSR